VSEKAQNGCRGRRGPLCVLITASALPLLVGCSSSSSVEYATDAYPSQSLVDLLKNSQSSPPPAPSAAPPAPAATDAAFPAPTSAPPPAPEPARAPVTAAASPPPAAATSAANDDPVAAAFPSVSLIDIVTGRKAGSQ
jgi:hypothetical protein